MNQAYKNIFNLSNIIFDIINLSLLAYFLYTVNHTGACAVILIETSKKALERFFLHSCVLAQQARSNQEHLDLKTNTKQITQETLSRNLDHSSEIIK